MRERQEELKQRQRRETSGQDWDGESCLSQLQSAYCSEKRIMETLEKLDQNENSFLPQIHLFPAKWHRATSE